MTKSTKSNVSCFITVRDPTLQKLTVVWVFLAAFGLTTLYLLLFVGRRLGWVRRPADPKIAWEASLVSNTSDLLLYPAVYISLTMVLSVTRAAQLADNDWGQTVGFAGAALYTSGGFMDVLLFTSVWNGIIAWRWGVWRDEPARRLSTFLPTEYHNGSGTQCV